MGGSFFEVVMRLKILLILSLSYFILSLSAYAEEYDESKRTEYLGLSYYDGNPMYCLRFSDPVNSSTWDDVIYVDCYRMNSGKSVESYVADLEYSYKISLSSGGWRYSLKRPDGDYSFDYYLMSYVDGKFVLFSSDVISNRLMPLLCDVELPVSSSDIGVSLYDTFVSRIGPWIVAAVGLALALLSFRSFRRFLIAFAEGAAVYGRGDKREIARYESGLKETRAARATERAKELEEKKKAEANARSLEAFREVEGIIDDLTSEDHYLTGEAWGEQFTAKVIESNRRLEQAWSYLRDDERNFLLSELKSISSERAITNSAFSSAFDGVAGYDESSIFGGGPFGDDEGDES